VIDWSGDVKVFKGVSYVPSKLNNMFLFLVFYVLFIVLAELINISFGLRYCLGFRHNKV